MISHKRILCFVIKVFTLFTFKSTSVVITPAIAIPDIQCTLSAMLCPKYVLVKLYCENSINTNGILIHFM